MIAPVSVIDLAHSYGGVLLNPAGNMMLAGLSIDSRSLRKGDWFVALQGDRFDGHDYIEQAELSGAAGLILERHTHLNSPLPQWVTEDSVVGLGQIAKEHRRMFDRPLVAITGSNGKTSVKEMLRGILDLSGATLATKGNFNNHIGVPLTLMNLSADHRYAVIEMGASALGEIQYLCDLAQPDVALVNNVGEAHIEKFGSVDDIRTAKGEIYAGLKPDGVAVVNLDMDTADRYMQSLSGRQHIGFSIEEKTADIHASNIQLKDMSSQFLLTIGSENHEVYLPAPALHNVANATAAAACAHALGIPAEEIVLGLSNFNGVAGRLESLPGIAGMQLIDDSYNANPTSANAAAELLASLDGRRVFVLGDMGELGDDAPLMHQRLGRYAADLGIDELFATGDMSRHTVKAFGMNGRWFDDQQALISALREIAAPDVVALAKGSRSSGMDAVIRALAAPKPASDTSPSSRRGEQ